MFEQTDLGLSRSIQHNSGQRKPPIVCFRCGLCCTWYQPKLTFAEAQLIADALELSLDVFRDRYVDEPPYGPDNLILGHRDGACVFLEYSEDGKTARCLIYSVRPSACREWAPSWSQKACQEGLVKYWGLRFDSSGQPEGSEQAIRRFRAFLESL